MAPHEPPNAAIELDPEPSASAGKVTDLLRAHVLDGTLPPGSRLIELQLAQDYGVSRFVVRAAIGELIKEGLVERQVNRGATVRRVDFDEAIKINEVRGVLEGFIARRAAHAATSSDHAELWSIIDQMRVALAADDLAQYSNLSATLHRRLREISGHPIATELVNNLRNRAVSHEIRLALLRGRTEESMVQHTEIVAAVTSGDGQGAELAMRARLESVAAALERAHSDLGRTN